MADWNCLYDKLIVRRRPAPEQVGSLAVPEAHRKAQNVGTVVVAGDGRLVAGNASLVPLTIKPGMEVLFSAFAGVPLEGEDRDLLILREDEVLAFRSSGLVP